MARIKKLKIKKKNSRNTRLRNELHKVGGDVNQFLGNREIELDQTPIHLNSKTGERSGPYATDVIENPRFDVITSDINDLDHHLEPLGLAPSKITEITEGDARARQLPRKAPQQMQYKPGVEPPVRKSIKKLKIKKKGSVNRRFRRMMQQEPEYKLAMRNEEGANPYTGLDPHMNQLTGKIQNKLSNTAAINYRNLDQSGMRPNEIDTAKEEIKRDMTRASKIRDRRDLHQLSKLGNIIEGDRKARVISDFSHVEPADPLNTKQPTSTEIKEPKKIKKLKIKKKAVNQQALDQTKQNYTEARKLGATHGEANNQSFKPILDLYDRSTRHRDREDTLAQQRMDGRWASEPDLKDDLLKPKHRTRENPVYSPEEDYTQEYINLPHEHYLNSVPRETEETVQSHGSGSDFDSPDKEDIYAWKEKYRKYRDAEERQEPDSGPFLATMQANLAREYEVLRQKYPQDVTLPYFKTLKKIKKLKIKKKMAVDRVSLNNAKMRQLIRDNAKIPDPIGNKDKPNYLSTDEDVANDLQLFSPSSVKPEDTEDTDREFANWYNQHQGRKKDREWEIAHLRNLHSQDAENAIEEQQGKDNVDYLANTRYTVDSAFPEDYRSIAEGDDNNFDERNPKIVRHSNNTKPPPVRKSIKKLKIKKKSTPPGGYKLGDRVIYSSVGENKDEFVDPPKQGVIAKVEGTDLYVNDLGGHQISVVRRGNRRYGNQRVDPAPKPEEKKLKIKKKMAVDPQRVAEGMRTFSRAKRRGNHPNDAEQDAHNQLVYTDGDEDYFDSREELGRRIRRMDNRQRIDPIP